MSKLYFSKKGLTLLFLLAISFSQSQTINTTYKTQINAKFAGLDKTKVPTKLLINQAMEFAELTDYSGTMSSTNFTTKGKFTNIYNTLLMSRVNATVTGLINPNTFKTNWDNLRAPNKIVLSGLYYKYNKFKTDAYPNFLVNNNGVITDKYVGGVWQNPYIDQQVFAIAAPILIYKSLSLQVTLPASLWYTNQASSVQSIAIDYGNGAGYQTMTLGQIHTVNYTASGTYEWKYKLTLTNAQILYSHSKLKIDIPVLETPSCNLNSVTQTKLASQAIVNSTSSSCTEIATIPFTGTRQYLGIANSATLQVRYRNSDCIISKPLIIVEGFDSGLLGVENPFGENDLFKFAQEAFDDTGNLPFEIINKDIIYINFNNGRDDLRRNAYLVEDIIKWVNTKKAQAGSTTPNAVIGQSMGGVIARYALRDMEILGQAHQTSLFVSHDAPQQGANIPVGVQYFARHLADQFIDTPVGDYQISLDGGSTISIADIQNLLNAQGTKQLLANSINSGFALDNTTFNAFQTELRNLGYPTQTRNIALSNGNHCANPQEFNPSAPLFNLYGNASATALTTFVTTLLQPLTNIAFSYFAYEFNEPGLLLGLLPGSSSFNMNFNAYALPSAGTNNQVYSGNISYTKKIFSLFGWDPQITVSLTNRSYNNPVALSYDYYPGGKYQLPFNFSTTTINNDFINLGISAYLAPSFNFIPVPSALDIGSGATILNNADYLSKYNAVTPLPAPRRSPFANFTTSFPNGANINETHISFNTRNGNWLATELDTDTNNNAIFDCTLICSDSQISGSTLCTTANYSAPPSNATYFNWTITQGANLVTLSNATSQTATLTKIGTGSGSITLSLILGNSICGSTVLTKTIWVGAPAFNLVRDNNESETCDTKYHYVKFFTYLPENVSLLEFTAISPSLGYTSNGNNSYTFKFAKGFSGYFNPIVKASNTCGVYIVEPAEEIYIGNCSSLTSQNKLSSNESTVYKIFPNPSSNIINISLFDETMVLSPQTIITAILYDLNGQEKRSVTVVNNTAVINVSHLIKGVYVLKINIDDVTESHQVIVE
nr:T9SS type A sorting domain-containing protein [uncultured Flavobacterium sp.]